MPGRVVVIFCSIWFAVPLAAYNSGPSSAPAYASLRGTVKVNRKQNVLKGTHSSGSPLKITLKR